MIPGQDEFHLLYDTVLKVDVLEYEDIKVKENYCKHLAKFKHLTLKLKDIFE
jgi:hypothetical protein